MSFFVFFVCFWPSYTILIWWWLDEHTIDAFLERLARFGLLMGAAAIVTLYALQGWNLLKLYNFI